MFQQRLNELKVRLEMTPTSPILIKEGRHFEQREGEQGKEWEQRLHIHQGVQRTPSRPRKRDSNVPGDYTNPKDCFDMAFVYTQDAAGRDHFYIPGSSLRGVLRRTAEQLVGRWQPKQALASDPFDNQAEKTIITQRDNAESPASHDIYRQAGLIERCFGHMALRGRWDIRDAWMKKEQDPHVIVRDGVGIDRETGAARNQVKYQFEAITAGVFTTTLTLVNYELWQLGMLAHVLAALDGGVVRMGYGTRRGLGTIRVRVAALEWCWYVPANKQPVAHNGDYIIPSLASLAAAQSLISDDAALSYGWLDSDTMLTLPLEQDNTPAEKRFASNIPVWCSPLAAGKPTNWDDVPWSRCGPLLEACVR